MVIWLSPLPSNRIPAVFTNTGGFGFSVKRLFHSFHSIIIYATSDIVIRRILMPQNMNYSTSCLMLIIHTAMFLTAITTLAWLYSIKPED